MFKNWLLLNKNWVLQNFPFLEDDFDALDDYVLFCKFMGYVEKVAITNERFLSELKNNLNEMYQEGKFDSLIEEIVNLQLTFTYPSIASMKLATNLVNGSFARTSGFYSYNDGGGSYYYVRTKTEDDTIDDVTIVGLSDETLIAELLIQDEMNVKEFGAKGDGETDDTEAIQLCFDTVKNIIIRDGTYMIDASISLKPQSNTYIKLVNATLKAITNSLDAYQIFDIDDVNNVIIEGGVIEGERTTHTGETGQSGHCIHIHGWSENITIKNAIIKDAWGDGIYINRARNVNTQNVICDNNRRQGVSVINIDGYHSLNDKFINTNGTAPESGIDIEPNVNTNIVKNVVLENLYTANNTGDGIDIWLNKLDSTSDPVSITILNHHDVGSGKGQRIGGHTDFRFNIIDENPLLENNLENGIDLRDWFDNEIDKLIINRPTIINCNTSEVQGASYVCGIAGYTNSEYDSKYIGGVSIIEPYITSKILTNIRGITFYDTTNTSRVKNIDIINPRNHQSNLSLAIIGDNIKFTDLYDQYIYSTNSDKTIGAAQLFSKVTNINNTTSRTITLGEALPIGYEITVLCEKNSYRPKIQFSSNDYCRYFNSTAGNLLTMDTVGLISLKKINNGEWFVNNLVGNVSVST